MITIDINNSGSAFDESRQEIARILRELAKKIEAGEEPNFVRDVNGNKCGTVWMQLEEQS